MWWMANVALAGTCDPAAIRAVADAIAGVNLPQRHLIAAVGFAEACPKAAIAKGATALGNVDPAQRGMIDARLALDDVAAWGRACTGGPAALAEMASVAPAEKRGLLWARCGLAKNPWFTEAEWNQGTGALVLPLMIGLTLAEEKLPADQAKVVVRAAAGIF